MADPLADAVALVEAAIQKADDEDHQAALAELRLIRAERKAQGRCIDCRRRSYGHTRCKVCRVKIYNRTHKPAT